MEEQPDKFYWFFCHDDGCWKIFNDIDQMNLEASGSTSSQVRVCGGRYRVDTQLKRMKSLFTEHKEFEVCRSSWMINETPLPEAECNKLSEWYLCGDSSKSPLVIGDRKYYKSSDGSVFLSGQTMVSPSLKLIRFGASSSSLTPPSANGDDPNLPVDHLIICVHGIGEAMWSRKVFNREPFESACETFRTLISDYRNSDENIKRGRVEVLHVKWFQILSESAYARHISDITLPTVPVLRQFANGAVSDVLFYLNENHRRDILDHVSKSIGYIYDEFKRENETRFSGKVTLVGHSLGSVICYDLLSQNRIDIDVDNLILLGSPLGMFLTSRGDNRDFIPILRCPRVFNIFHPNDPVAYRLEPLINPLMKDSEPDIVPYYLTGGLATHTKLRQATSSIINMFTGPDSLRGTSTYIDKLAQLMKGNTSPKPESPLGIAIREVETLNDGKRIDWSLQQESLVSNEYAEALGAHVAYLRDRSVARFMHEQLR